MFTGDVVLGQLRRLQVCASTSTGSLGVLDIPSHAYRTLLRSHAGAVTSAAFDPSPDRDEVS